MRRQGEQPKPEVLKSEPSANIVKSRLWNWWLHCKPGQALTVCLAIGLVLRLIWLILIPNEPISDQIVYHHGAVSLADGRGFLFASADPNGFWPVGYSAFIAIPYALIGAFPTTGYALNILFGLSLVAGSFLLARALFVSPQVPKWTALMMAVYPSFIAYVTILASENAYLPLSLFVLVCGWFMQSANGIKGWLYAVLAGVFLGLALAVRPPALALPTVLLVLAWARGASPFSAAAKIALVSLLAVALNIPWGLRNQREFGEFKLSAFNSGPVLWFGNHEGAPEIYIPDRFKQLSFPERDKAMRAEAVAHIKEHPGLFIKRCIRRVWVAMRAETIAAVWNEPGLTQRFGASSIGFFKALFSAGYFTVLLGGLFVLISRLRRRVIERRDFVLWVAMAVSAAPFVVFDSQNRYHLPLVPFLAMYLAYGLSAWGEKSNQHA